MMWTARRESRVRIPGAPISVHSQAHLSYHAAMVKPLGLNWYQSSGLRQILESLVLGRGEMDLASVHGDAPPLDVEDQPTHLKAAITGCPCQLAGVAERHTNARHQLPAAERLREVVVGTHLERGHLV